MATITVRNLDDDVQQRLKLRAAAHGRSMESEARAIISAAVTDDAHVAEQKERYRARRDALRPALEAFDLRIEHSEAGLYLWATADEDCWDTLDRLCAAGILVAPGAFYGAAGRRHVRVALTASDERIATAVERLTRWR